MATVHRTQERGSTLGALLHFLNPFKSREKSELPETEARQEKKSAETQTSQPSARATQAPGKKAHRRRRRKHHGRKAQASSSAHASTARIDEKPQDLDRHDVRPQSEIEKDPAHRPGHRTFDVKSEFTHPTGGKVETQKSALNNYPDSERIRQMESPQRRINSPSRTASKRGRSLPKST